jgi:hypothetical protein
MSEITRLDIAGALDGITVPWSDETRTITATAAQPAALSVWQAWPDWQSSRWLSMCAIERTWLVYVILPAADAPSWTEATDAILNRVRTALIPLGQVQRAEPVALRMADQSISLPAVAFTLLTS